VQVFHDVVVVLGQAQGRPFDLVEDAPVCLEVLDSQDGKALLDLYAYT